MEVEKNDVNISKLFVWGRVYEIVNTKDEVEALVYMRLLGDADINRARVFALRKSAELRRKLNDASSDEHIATIKGIDEITVKDIINFIVLFSIRDIRNKAHHEVKIPRPKEPKSDSSLEVMEKFQAEVDEYPKRYSSAMQEFVIKEVESLKKKLYDENNKKELYKMYKKLIIDELCELEATRAFKDMEIFLGCFRDDEYKVKFFDAFEQYENLPTETKVDIRAAYETLNVPLDELKKLREATQ